MIQLFPHRYWLLIIGTFFFLSSCQDQKNQSPITTLHTEDDVSLVKEWNTFGPIYRDTLDNDDYFELKLKNKNNNKLFQDEINWILSHPEKGRNARTQEFFLNFWDLTTDSIHKLDCYYAHTMFNSITDTTVIAIIDGSQNYHIWINNQPLIQVEGKYSNFRNADRFVAVRLKKGKNHIIAKSNPGTDKRVWKILFGFTNKTKATELYTSNYGSEFVENTIFEDTLRIYTGHIQNAEIQLSHSITNVVLQKSDLKETKNGYVNLPIVFSEKGMLNCTLKLKEDTLKMQVFRGDIKRFEQQLAKDASLLTMPELLQKDLEAGFYRIKHINKLHFINSPSEQQYRSKNLVFWTNAVYNTLLNFKKTGENLAPNTSIRTYKSSIDQQQFLFHASAKTLAQKNIPLVIIPPFKLNSDTLAKSWYIGLLSQIECDAQQADKYGFAVAWLFMRGVNYSRIFARQDAKGVIERLKRELPITDNIFLLGDCLGAQRAVELASDEKGQYKALALFSPATLSIDNYDIGRIKDLPIYVDHGIYDQESPINNTYNFVEEALQQNSRITMHTSKTAHHRLERDYRSLGFHFFYTTLQKYKQNSDY